MDGICGTRYQIMGWLQIPQRATHSLAKGRQRLGDFGEIATRLLLVPYLEITQSLG
jgi:hypothetical protein